MTTPILSGMTATNWDQYGLADIWDMVKHEDGATSTDHVRAWAIMNELCDGQAKRLNAAAAQLAQHWPPERSPAAAVFIERLKGMAQVFTDAAAAAGRNSGAVQNLTTGLLDTRSRVKELRETWRYWEGQEAKRVAETRKLFKLSFPIAGNLSDEQILAVSNVDPTKTLVRLSGAPEVPTDWRSRLDGNARDVMRASDRDINETRSRIQQPPVIEGGDMTSETWPPVREPSTGNQGGAGPPRGGGFSGGTHGLDIPAPTFNLPTAMPGRSPWTNGDAGEGPILSGGESPIAATSPTFSSGPLAPLPAQPSPLTTFWTPATGIPGPGLIIGPRAPSAQSHASAPDRVPPRRGPLGQPAIVEERSGTRGAGAGFVAPPGGVIGRQTNGAGTRSGPMVPNSARRRRRNDPIDGWGVAEGIPAVLEPPADVDSHEPGPGVFGIDR